MVANKRMLSCVLVVVVVGSVGTAGQEVTRGKSIIGHTVFIKFNLQQSSMGL